MRGGMVAIVLALCIIGAPAQQQIPNAGLEEWTVVKGSSGFKDYEEPTDGWTSGNGVIHIASGSDPVCERSTDAHGGSACAKLTTRRIFGQIASGSLYLGVFQLNLVNPASSARRGIPFAGPVPTRFRGWYRYAPSGSDSAAIYAMFTRWDGSKRVLLGEARIVIRTAAAPWTSFDLAVPVLNGVPDSMSVVAASSAGGENFRGEIGSTLWVDDLSFSWETVSVHNQEVDVSCRLVGSSLRIDGPADVARVLATDLRGRMVHLGAPNSREVSCDVLSSGLWSFRVIAPDGRIVASTIGILNP